MSDLRKNLEKQRELEKTYNQYRIDKDRLDLEEAQELREARRTGRLLTAAGKAASALGKIGASKAGALVTGDLVPDLNLDKYADDSISDEYDTKRLSMNEKALNIRGEIDEVEDQRRVAKEEERIRKEEERKTEKAKKESLKIKEKASAYRLKAEEKAKGLVKDNLVLAVKEDRMDGNEAIEILEDKGIPEEMLEPFRETIKPPLWPEDEKLQVKTLKELQEKLRLLFIKNRVSQELKAGKPFSPELLKALDMNTEDFTPEKPKESLTKESGTDMIRLEITYPDGTKQIVTRPQEEAMNIMEKSTELGTKVKRLK